MQQRLFIDKYDIFGIMGQFIVQIDNNDFSNTIIKDGKIDFFWIEKRISQVIEAKEIRESKYMLSGIYYPHSNLISLDKLVEKINNGYEDRHYRLMTADEVKLVIEYNLSKIIKYGNSEREHAIAYKKRKAEKLKCT